MLASHKMDAPPVYLLICIDKIMRVHIVTIAFKGILFYYIILINSDNSDTSGLPINYFTNLALTKIFLSNNTTIFLDLRIKQTENKIL